MAVDEPRGRRQIMKDVRVRALLPPSSLDRRVHSEAGCSEAAMGGVDQVSHAMQCALFIPICMCYLCSRMTKTYLFGGELRLFWFLELKYRFNCKDCDEMLRQLASCYWSIIYKEK
jgi:hypothetical protein